MCAGQRLIRFMSPIPTRPSRSAVELASFPPVPSVIIALHPPLVAAVFSDSGDVVDSGAATVSVMGVVVGSGVGSSLLSPMISA